MKIGSLGFNLEQVGGLSALLSGMALLVLVLAFHGYFMGVINQSYQARSKKALEDAFFLKAICWFFLSMLLLMLTHIGEIFLWALSLMSLGIVPDLGQGLVFCGSTYTTTTIGYATNGLPLGWKLISVFIALSGIFNFAWSTSVMLEMLPNFRQARVSRSNLVNTRKNPIKH